MIVLKGDVGLKLDETLLPEVMHELGNYKNYALGKWHLGHSTPAYLPTARGFHNFLGYLAGKNYYWSKKTPDYPTVKDFMYANKTCYEEYDDADANDYSTFLYRDHAIKSVQDHDFDANPMFMYFAAQAVHDPFADCGEDEYSVYNEGIPESYMSNIGSETYAGVAEKVVGAKRQQYAMALMLLDNAVKQIYNALDARNQLDNTYFIFASDNGACKFSGGKNAPLRGSKGTLFEGGVRVDAFISSPLLPTASKGTTYDGLMHVSDWFPTMLDFAGMLDDFKPQDGEIDKGEQTLLGFFFYYVK